MKGEVNYTNCDKSNWEMINSHQLICPYCKYQTALDTHRIYNYCERCGESLRGLWHYEDEVN